MLGAPLAALPQKLLAEVVGFVIETALVVAVTWHFVAGHYELKIAAKDAERERAVAAAAVAAQTETTRRVAAQQEVAHAAQIQADAARADAATASRARDALRVQLDVFVRAHRGAGDPGAAGGGAPAGDPIGVLADVLGRADERAGVLAGIADQRGVAGAACERAYDALTVTP
jgi:hypothetical protein